MKNSQRIPMRKLSMEMKQITKKYLTSQIRQKLSQADRLGSSPEEEQRKISYQSYIDAFDLALSALEPTHRMIIHNDYIHLTFAFWWEQKYSRSTYYRHKYEALIQFLSLFANL